MAAAGLIIRLVVPREGRIVADSSARAMKQRMKPLSALVGFAGLSTFCNCAPALSKLVAGRLSTTCGMRLPLLLLLTLPAVVQAQFTFTTNNGTIKITGYTGPGGDVVIPDNTNGYPVTSVANYAFSFRTNVISVLISDSITNIEYSAFRQCPDLAIATLGNGVISIGDYAFGSCRNLVAISFGNALRSVVGSAFDSCVKLASVEIPGSVTNLSTIAFSSCDSLTAINVSISNPIYSSIDGIVYDKNQKNLMQCPVGKTGTATILASVTNIFLGALQSMARLSEIVVDPANLKYSSLAGALFDKNRAALIRYPGALHGEYTVPDTVVRIKYGAFWQCSLVGVSMLSNLRVIENSAFSYSGNLASLSIGDSVTNIGYAAFFACSNLPSATIPASVLYIGDEAFRRCSSLSAITVELSNPNYCSEDGVLFNKNKTALVQMPPAKAITSYSIPETVTEVRLYCFFDCHLLTSITLPSSLTKIGEGAFGFCDGLTTMSVPHSVTNIGQSVWSDCTSLTNVILGTAITNLSGYTFAGCYNLAAVYFEGNAPAGATSMDFLLASNTIVYYLPGTTGWTTTLGGRPTALWNPLIQTGDGTFGVQANGFGFTITGTMNIPIVVAACTDPANPTWLPLQTCTLTNGSIYFSDPDWTNYPARLYRIRSP